MDTLWVKILMVFGAYLIGSIPSAYIFARLLRGVDIRTYGTGTVGASNFSQLVGKRVSTSIVLFDMIVKGSVPALLASDKVLGLGIWTEVAAGLAAIVGHNWSILIGFKGGRGITTFLGVLGALNFFLMALYMISALIAWLSVKKTDAAISWSVAILLLPIISTVVWLWLELPDLPVLPFINWDINAVLQTMIGPEMLLCSSVFLVIISIKRLVGNGSLFQKESKQPLREVVFNRLFFDRDIRDKAEWLKRNRPNPEIAKT